VEVKRYRSLASKVTQLKELTFVLHTEKYHSIAKKNILFIFFLLSIITFNNKKYFLASSLKMYSSSFRNIQYHIFKIRIYSLLKYKILKKIRFD